MKNLSKKQKIIFIITVIFFCTSIAVKIKNYSITMKAINKKRDFIEQKIEGDTRKSGNNTVDTIKNKPKSNFNVNSNKNLQNKDEVKNRIAELWTTLDEATDYLKNNIDNKDKKEEISVLIDDCINALNSIENASTKIKDEDVVNATKSIRKIKEDFKKLKKTFKEGDLHKCKEILVFHRV